MEPGHSDIHPLPSHPSDLSLEWPLWEEHFGIWKGKERLRRERETAYRALRLDEVDKVRIEERRER